MPLTAEPTVDLRVRSQWVSNDPVCFTCRFQSCRRCQCKGFILCATAEPYLYHTSSGSLISTRGTAIGPRTQIQAAGIGRGSIRTLNSWKHETTEEESQSTNVICTHEVLGSEALLRKISTPIPGTGIVQERNAQTHGYLVDDFSPWDSRKFNGRSIRPCCMRRTYVSLRR